MKKQTIALALITVISGTLFFSFANSTIYSHKGKGLQTAPAQSDYQAYKKEQEEKIKNNEKRIAELKMEKANADKAVADAYNKRVAGLEQKNTELRNKITTYKYEGSKWDQFKREFNHDMDELGKSLKDIGKDNVK